MVSLRGSVFRQILFNISVNDVDSGNESKLADGTEVSGAVDLLEGGGCYPEGLQQAGVVGQ